MQRLIWLLSGLLISSVAGGINSSPAMLALSNDSRNLIKKNLSHHLPDLTINNILATPIAGVYEIDSGHRVFYVDATGNYAFIGNLFDLTAKTSLTEARVTELSIINWAALPVNGAIKRVLGNGKNKIAVFTDPDCPFCHRFEAETLSKLNNITIYYYLFPLPIHANALNNSKRILCTENPESSLLSFMAGNNSGLTINNSCPNAQKLNIMREAGYNSVQVTVTPTTVLPNGKIVTGLIPLNSLTKLIEDNAAESSVIANSK